MALQKNGSANRSLLRPSLFIYNVYKVQNSINHMLNPSADRDVNNIYQLSTEKARQWWNNQAFESRKNIVIESEAVINDDKLVEDQTIADIADKDYDDLPDTTKQEVELQVEDYEEMEELFEVKDDEYLKCSMCEDIFTSNDDYELHKSVDHGEEPEDFEESEETYQLTMHPELTRESLRKANNLLTETEERQLYSNYDKNGDVQSSIMPYNLPPVATGKYNDNPNKFFYSNKIFRAGSSTERTSSLGEAKASEEFDISKYYKEVTEDGWMDYQCNSCGKKIDPDDGYGDQKDYDVIIQELKDHQINHKFIYESTDRFEADIENDQVVQKLPDDKRSFDVEASENNLYRSPDGEFNEQWENAYWDNRLSNAMEDNYGYEQIMEDILRLMDSDSTHSDYYNMRYQQVADAERNRGLGGESKATEKGEWDWLDKGADSKSVDYDEVEYKDDGVSDISIQNAEPKLKDQNAFLDNVNIGVESVDYVYKTKAHEAMEKTYIPVSETFEEDYEEFEDSDEAMIKETITLRKLTGYGDDAIARELNINYGVSHEEALEKVYSVEVSTNDRVSQTFFGKMYRECTESEKDELRMYSGSD